MKKSFNYINEEYAIEKLDEDNIKLQATKQLKARKRQEIGSLHRWKVRIGLCASSKFNFDSEIKVEEEVTGILAYATDNECKLDDPSVPNLRVVPMFRILTCERV